MNGYFSTPSPTQPIIKLFDLKQYFRCKIVSQCFIVRVDHFFSHLYFIFFELSMSFVHFSVRLLGVFLVICLYVLKKFSPLLYELQIYVQVFCLLLTLYVYFSHMKVFIFMSSNLSILYFMISWFCGILRPKSTGIFF